LLFGLVSLRVGVYPRAAVVVLMIGAALTFVPLPGGQVVFEVAVAWLGLVLLSRNQISETTRAREVNPVQ
jgi:hypothetical protein